MCHAHLDKMTHARPLVAALNKRGISCWLDEAEIFPGASLIDAINDGLATAQYVLVIITENFLQRNWTQRELNAALSREIRMGAVMTIHETTSGLYGSACCRLLRCSVANIV
jgi:TIR domain